MSCGSGEVRVAKTSENMELVERKREAIENLVGGAVLKGFGGVKVEQECGSVKGFDPIYGGHTCLEKKGSDHVICRANDALGFAVLVGCVWTRHA